MVKSFRIFNWKLLMAIFLTLLIPALYDVSKVYFVGEVRGEHPFSIAGNLNWINVLFEVLEEAFLLPLFFVLSKLVKQKNANRLIVGKVYIITFIYLVFILLCIVFTKQLLHFMNPAQKDHQVMHFIKVELLSRFPILMVKIISIFLIAKEKWKQLMVFLALKTALNVLMDFFVVGDNRFSQRAGIVWIAWNQLIASVTITLASGFAVIKAYKIKVNDIIHPRFLTNASGWKQNFWNGAESFLRNAFFIWFVLKTINTLPNAYSQGDFWVMNVFIWNWLLLPIIALSQYINRDQAFKSGEHSLKERMFAPFLIVTIVIGVWLASIPGWTPFIKTIMNNDNASEIAHLALISIGFYILYAYNSVIDNIFLGSGRASFLFWQSLITNVVVFVPYYYFGSITNLEDIVIMMGLAIGVDSVLTFAMFGHYIRKSDSIRLAN